MQMQSTKKEGRVYSRVYIAKEEGRITWQSPEYCITLSTTRGSSCFQVNKGSFWTTIRDSVSGENAWESVREVPIKEGDQSSESSSEASSPKKPASQGLEDGGFGNERRRSRSARRGLH